MQKIITPENVRRFAYINDAVCKGEIRGVAVDFMGLGGAVMLNEDTERGKRLGAQGVLYVIPYLNPWNWMNSFAVEETDQILDAVMEMVGKKLKVVSTGGSMGGLAGLVYTRYSRHAPVASVTNCPVCDLPYHFTERPDLPRTLYSAFGDVKADTLEEAMEKSSPLHLAMKGEMPDVPYTVFHCEKDSAVNKQKHSDRFVRAMTGRRVEYIPVPDRDHCDLPNELILLFEQRICEALA